MSWRYSRAGQRQTLGSSRLRRGTDTFKYRYLEKGGGWGAKKSAFNVTQNSAKKREKENLHQCATVSHSKADFLYQPIFLPPALPLSFCCSLFFNLDPNTCRRGHFKHVVDNC